MNPELLERSATLRKLAKPRLLLASSLLSILPLREHGYNRTAPIASAFNPIDIGRNRLVNRSEFLDTGNELDDFRKRIAR